MKKGFNPRTRVGCDAFDGQACPPAQGFNPRTRVGCDEQTVHAVRDAGLVSIHAPAWGATPYPLRYLSRQKCFNPRTRVGCDNANESPFRLMKCFNPRTRVGCDDIWC